MSSYLPCKPGTISHRAACPPSERLFVRHGLVKPADVTCACPRGPTVPGHFYPLHAPIYHRTTTPIAHRVTSIAHRERLRHRASSAGQLLLLRPPTLNCPCREPSHPCASPRALAPSCRSPSELSLGYALGAASTCAASSSSLWFLVPLPLTAPAAGVPMRVPRPDPCPFPPRRHHSRSRMRRQSSRSRIRACAAAC